VASLNILVQYKVNETRESQMKVFSENLEELEKFQLQLKFRLASRWNCEIPEGCTTAEVNMLSATLDAELPAIYRAFLEMSGRSAGNLFDGYNWSFRSFESRQQRLKTECDESNCEYFPERLCFLDYAGDNFWCFDINTGCNPIVYRLDAWDKWNDIEVRLDGFFIKWDQLE